MMNIKYVVGCDIRGYTNLSIQKQKLLTAHLYGCHLKSLAVMELDTEQYNDTGDGFFAVFSLENVVDDNVFHQYMLQLSKYYLSEIDPSLSDILSRHWLKIAGGKGEIRYIAGRQIRGDGINTVSRVLDVAKLPIPLELQKQPQRQSGMTFSDKHGNRWCVSPVFINESDAENQRYHILAEPSFSSNALQSAAKAQLIPLIENPFFYLKRPDFTTTTYDLNEKIYDDLNKYINFGQEILKYVYSDHNESEKRESNLEQLSGNCPDLLSTNLDSRTIAETLIFGHTLEGVYKFLEQYAGWLERNDIDPQCYPVKLVFLDPASPDAMLSDENNNCLQIKIVNSLQEIAKLIHGHPVLEHIKIKFTDRLLSIGVHKVLDHMVVINYGDGYIGKKSSFELYNFFASSKESSSYLTYDEYFQRLYRGGQNDLLVDMSKEISGHDLEAFINGIKFESAATHTNSSPHHAHFSYKKFIDDEFECNLLRARGGKMQIDGFRQVELHPSDSCNLSCTFCQGAGAKSSGQILNISVYEAFLSSLGGEVDKVILSGEFSEPTLYPHFADLVEAVTNKCPDKAVGLYTNGITQLSATLDCLKPNLANWVIINLPTLDEARYQDITKKDFQNTVIDNLLYLQRLKNKRTLAGITINYELVMDNAIDLLITRMLACLTANKISCTIRLTVPIVPLNKTLDRDFIIGIQAAHQEIIGKLTSIKPSKGITIVNSFSSAARNTFSQCYAMYDSLVIRPDGKVAPCCYTANSTFDDLSYGSIDTDNYQVLCKKRDDVFQRIAEIKPRNLCPPCSKKDHYINSLARKNQRCSPD